LYATRIFPEARHFLLRQLENRGEGDYLRWLDADVLRTRYVRSPAWLKTGLSPVLSLIPMTARYGPAYERLRLDLRRSSADPDLAQALQLEALRHTTRIVLQRSRFYRERMTEVFGGPVDWRSFGHADLRRLPITTREQVAADPGSLLVVHPREADLRQTSGSSGRPPLRIYLDRDRSVREMAFLHHIWSRIGYRLGDGRAILRDYGGNIPTLRRTWRYDRALRELWLSPFDLREEAMAEYLELLHRYQVRWLYGVPSAISTLANHARRLGWQPPACFKGVLPASESLFENQRKGIAAAFGGRPILPSYGLSERVAIAGEVPGKPQTYAFEPLYGVTELVDAQGEPVSEVGARGRIVATGFISAAMPLIRYETGDSANLVAPASAANGHMIQLGGINSRWSQEFVFGRAGEPISVISLDQENYADLIRDYQYCQEVLGRVVLKVVPCKGVGMDRLEAVLRPARQRVAAVLDIAIEAVDQLPAGPTGKRAFVDQRLELPLILTLTHPSIPARAGSALVPTRPLRA
jgi:phenylacetate-CoA ligase